MNSFLKKLYSVVEAQRYSKDLILVTLEEICKEEINTWNIYEQMDNLTGDREFAREMEELINDEMIDDFFFHKELRLIVGKAYRKVLYGK